MRYDLESGSFIELESMEKYSKVPKSFICSGHLPEIWIQSKNSSQQRSSVSLEFLDINGIGFFYTSMPVVHMDKRLFFSWQISIHEVMWSHIVASQGRITMRLLGENEENDYFFLPIIIQGFDSVTHEIEDKHRTIEKRCKILEKRFKELNSKLDKVYKKYNFNHDFDVGSQYESGVNVRNLDFLSCLEFAISVPENEKRSQLYEEYKDVIDWVGSIPCKGLVDELNGFEFRVHSHDHDTHFHIIHRDKGIDARFSFPDIELLNYKKEKQRINSKQIKSIQKFFSKSENFEKLKHEIERR